MAPHTGFPGLGSIWLLAAYLATTIPYVAFTKTWLVLVYLRYVGHVGRGGICRLNMRRMDSEDCLLCCWETALWRLCIRGRCHGRWGWCQPSVVNG